MAKKKKQPTPQRAKKTPKQLEPGLLQSWLGNIRLVATLLFLFACLIYANTLGNGYTQDDAIVITENMFTKDGVNGFGGILSKDTFFGFFKEEGKAALVAGGRYRPFTLLMFAVEYQLFGENLLVSHLVNTLLFGFTCVVLYFLQLQLLRAKGEMMALVVSFMAALLFASHPIHTEVVANIKGRDEIMALLGSLGALYFALRYVRTNAPIQLLWSTLCFFVGLLSKENAITFLAIVPLSFYFFTNAKLSKIVMASAPLFLAAALFIALRTSVLGFSFSEPSMELMNNPFIKIEGNTYTKFTASEKLATVTYSMGKYLQLLAFPYPLTHDYYPRHIDLMQWSDWRVLLSLLAYFGLLVVAVLGLRQKSVYSYAIWYYLLTFSIVSNVLFPVGVHMAERLIYMPSVGFCLLVAYGLYQLSTRNKKRPFSLTTFYPALGIIGAIALLFGGMTIQRNQAWKDNFTLFTTDIKTSKNSAKLRNAVGGELTTQAVKLPEGNAQRTRMLQEAVGHLQEAVRLHPNYKNAYLLLGNANNHLKAYEESIAYYGKALAIDPDYADARKNLGITYTQAGRHYGEQKGDLQQSVQYLTKALEFRPDDYETLRLLGVANGIAQNNAQAVDYFAKALAQKPDDADANFNLAVAYYNMNDTIQGNRYRDKALEVDPQFLEKRQQRQ
ncbi:MAG: tetratricopeptide repeat protein [Bacteroidota bacterium]